MHYTSKDIDHILNLPQWESLQDYLALATNMAIITIDYKGTPVTKHSKRCEFCGTVRADPKLNKLCETCDARGGLEAVRSSRPYIYLCHFNIVDIAIPIVVGNKYIGAIMAGQIKLPERDLVSKESPLERILTNEKNPQAIAHLDKYRQSYDAIPEMTLDEVKRFADMLFQLCNYIVNSSPHAQSDVYPLPGDFPRPTEEKSGADIDSYYDLQQRKHLIDNASILNPALEAISNNKEMNYTQAQMAQLCHISPSYFSRLFLKETGLSFTQYVSRLKIDWAKQMLERTNYPLSQISDELGFSSPSYFTKVFKSVEKITPNLYRKYYQDSTYKVIPGSRKREW